jgi:hypothetical protein
MEPPSAAVLAILARPPSVLPVERYDNLDRDEISLALEDSFKSKGSGTVLNPVMFAAATNQPQLLERLLRFLPDLLGGTIRLVSSARSTFNGRHRGTKMGCGSLVPGRRPALARSFDCYARRGHE